MTTQPLTLAELATGEALFQDIDKPQDSPAAFEWLWSNRTALLSAARRLVEIGEAWQRYQFDDLSQEEFEGVVAERIETPGEGMARAVAKQNARAAKETP